MSQTSSAGRSALLALLFALLAAPAALAQPGALDPTLGGDGVVFHDNTGTATAVLPLPDGRAVLAGYRVELLDEFSSLLRYFPDGTLDPSFGGDGQVIPVFEGDFGTTAHIYDALLLPDGKILAAGYRDFTPGPREQAFGGLAFVARFLPDGALDPTFGDGGATSFAFGVLGSEMWALALQPDGKIVAVSREHLVCLLPDGTPDPAFGADGIVETPTSRDSRPAGLLALPDGKIMVGVHLEGREPHAAIARYLPDGTLDPTFGDGGVFVFPDASAGARGIVRLPDGRLLVLVTISGAYRLYQFLPDWTPDPSFGGGDGEFTAEPPHRARRLVLQPDGKIVVAGWFGLPGSAENHLVGRHLPDGALDTAFGDGGYAVYDFAEGQFDAAAAVAVLPDGRIVIGGGIEFAEYASTFARYLGDAPVAVSAAPAAPPAVIPPAGGAFPFTIHLANATDGPLAVQVWTEADGPAPRSPVLGPRVARLAPGEVLTRTITQHVPARAGR